MPWCVCDSITAQNSSWSTCSTQEHTASSQVSCTSLLLFIPPNSWCEDSYQVPTHRPEGRRQRSLAGSSPILPSALQDVRRQHSVRDLRTVPVHWPGLALARASSTLSLLLLSRESMALAMSADMHSDLWTAIKIGVPYAHAHTHVVFVRQIYIQVYKIKIA